MKQHIPNILTLLNLLCGCIAIIFAFRDRLELVAFFVVLGILFDFLDGFAARMLRVSSELGLQLDSLADLVTSGVVPGIVMFRLLDMSQNEAWFFDWFNVESELLPFLGFLITLGSGYRLAIFNIDDSQATVFKGLPTPANTLLIISLPLILLYQNNEVLNDCILNPWFLIGLTLLSTFLLNSGIPLFSLKLKGIQFKDNALPYLSLIGSLVLLLTLKFLAIPVIIIGYVLISLIIKPKAA